MVLAAQADSKWSRLFWVVKVVPAGQAISNSSGWFDGFKVTFGTYSQVVASLSDWFALLDLKDAWTFISWC